MDKLYLILKTAIDNCVKKGHLPYLYFQWEYNQMEELDQFVRDHPLVLFQFVQVIFENPDDNYSVGEMEFTIKVFFDGLLDDSDSKQKAMDGFELLKKLEAIIKSVENEMIGPVVTKKIELMPAKKYENCFKYTFATPCYPPLRIKDGSLYCSK